MKLKSLFSVSHSWLAVAFIVLNIADGAITAALTKIGGTELSPIWRYFLANTTIQEFVVTKIVLAFIFAVILSIVGFTYPDTAKRILIGLVIGMTIVFIINAVNLSAFFAGLAG